MVAHMVMVVNMVGVFHLVVTIDANIVATIKTTQSAPGAVEIWHTGAPTLVRAVLWATLLPLSHWADPNRCSTMIGGLQVLALFL